MSAPIVFFDLAGPDRNVLSGFYSELFNWEVSADGTFSTAVASPMESQPFLNGSFREDPAETVIYIGVNNITETLKKVTEHGGEIDKPRFEVPGVVILGLFKDPAGNRIGLVEMENGKVKVP